MRLTAYDSMKGIFPNNILCNYDYIYLWMRFKQGINGEMREPINVLCVVLRGVIPPITPVLVI